MTEPDDTYELYHRDGTPLGGTMRSIAEVATAMTEAQAQLGPSQPCELNLRVHDERDRERHGETPMIRLSREPGQTTDWHVGMRGIDGDHDATIYPSDMQWAGVATTAIELALAVRQEVCNQELAQRGLAGKPPADVQPGW